MSHVCHFHHIRDRIDITSTLNSYLYNLNSPHIQHITVTSHIKTVSVFIGNHVAFLVFLAILLDFYHILKLSLSITEANTGLVLNDTFASGHPNQASWAEQERALTTEQKKDVDPWEQTGYKFWTLSGERKTTTSSTDKKKLTGKNKKARRGTSESGLLKSPIWCEREKKKVLDSKEVLG